MFEHILSALQALNANKIRAALTMLGVVIGVLAVTLLVGVGDGARAYLDRTLSGLGTNLLNIIPGRTETRGFGPPAQGVERPLTMDDARALERQATLLRGVSPIVSGGGTIRYLNRQRDTIVLGVGPAFSDLRNMHVDRGEFIREEDLTSRRRVCVLGRKVVRELFGDQNALGQPIRIAGGRYRVIGHHGGEGPLARLRPRRPGVHPRHRRDGPVQPPGALAAPGGGAEQGGRARRRPRGGGHPRAAPPGASARSPSRARTTCSRPSAPSPPR